MVGIQAGDELQSCRESATVRCELKTLCDRGTAEMVSVTNGLVYPIKQGDCWVFLKEVIAAEEVVCDAVYSFVLVCGHVVSIDGAECLCIGHGILEEPVASRLFFGTNKVIEELQRLLG